VLDHTDDNDDAVDAGSDKDDGGAADLWPVDAAASDSDEAAQQGTSSEGSDSEDEELMRLLAEEEAAARTKAKAGDTSTSAQKVATGSATATAATSSNNDDDDNDSQDESDDEVGPLTSERWPASIALSTRRGGRLSTRATRWARSRSSGTMTFRILGTTLTGSGYGGRPRATNSSASSARWRTQTAGGTPLS
jgi:hypothetical protein